MPDFWRRFGAPIAFGVLALFTTITMVADRRAIRDETRDLPWWQAVVLEITVPIQISQGHVPGLIRKWSRVPNKRARSIVQPDICRGKGVQVTVSIQVT